MPVKATSSPVVRRKPPHAADDMYRCKCGCEFEYGLGKYGCPNCCGDSGAARVVRQKKPTAMKFTIPYIPPTTLGQNAHKHWRSKAPDEKNAHIIGRGAVHGTRYTKADVPEMPVLVWVIHWDKASRRKDDDNALGTLKHLRDGICAGLDIDDKRFLTSMVFQKLDPKKVGFTELIIREATREERRIACQP